MGTFRRRANADDQKPHRHRKRRSGPDARLFQRSAKGTDSAPPPRRGTREVLRRCVQPVPVLRAFLRGRQTLKTIAALLLLACGAFAAEESPARSIFRQLVEINTTDSTGGTT